LFTSHNYKIVETISGTYDPNYQTLAGIGGEVFGADKAGPGAGAAPQALNAPAAGAAPQVPAGGGMAGKLQAIIFSGTFDPNYQTLAGIGGDVFGADKKATGGNDGARPKAPENKEAKAGVYDPNYQTLAGVAGDVFGEDKKKNAERVEEPRAPENKNAKAGIYDPNYQTLAGVGNDVFGQDKKK
uniref:Outer membrane protein n=1 Tax=Thelazia callipaeda TaxID=103827 RepID=A0A0N5CQP8_THECL